MYIAVINTKKYCTELHRTYKGGELKSLHKEDNIFDLVNVKRLD